MFSLAGKNGSDHISIKTVGNSGSGHDGAVYKCELSIVAGCLGVEFKELYVAEGEIESFLESLEVTGNQLIEKGSFTNEDLFFTLTSNKYGHVLVEGVFDQNNGDGYMCRFGFESDITCVEQVKRELERRYEQD